LGLYSHGCGLGGGRVDAIYTPSTHIIKPSPVELVGVNIEADAQFLTTLDVHGLNAIGTEHAEYAFLRILFVGFNDVVLALPSVARAAGYSSLFGQNGYNLSFYFHI
jgi:hypothetical protein